MSEISAESNGTPEPQTVPIDVSADADVTKGSGPFTAALAGFPLFPAGDALAGGMPGFDILPCLRCGTAFTGAPPEVTGRAHVLGRLNYLAKEAGWTWDAYGVWTCPQCQQDGARRAAEAYAAQALLLAPGDYPDVLAEFDARARVIMAGFADGVFEPGRWRYAEPGGQHHVAPAAGRSAAA